MEHQLVSNMDPIKITCPHCGADECYKESQTLPDNQNVDSYMCVGCGYTTTSMNIDESEMIKQYESTTAELVKQLRWVDENNIVWYPIVLNFPSFGIIFPDGTSKHEWSWRAAPAVDIEPSEQSKYPVPGQKDSFYTRRIDMALGKEFSKDSFNEACKFIGFIQ